MAKTEEKIIDNTNGWQAWGAIEHPFIASYVRTNQ